MAVDESGQEETKPTTKPVKRVSVPPTAQALSSTDIETAPEQHPIFRMPLGWGERLGSAEVRI